MLVTFEGLDGSGKSTQVRLLTERLKAEGFPTLAVREPGGTPLSERVRELLLDPGLHIVPFAELLLFSAARAQLVAERIRPELARGSVVVCDRFYDSSTAYQGGGRGLESLEWFRSFNARVTGGLRPDRTYLIELTPEQAFARRAAADADRMEAAGLAFFARVAEAYRRLAEEEPDRFVRIDGTLPIDVIHAQIWADLWPRLARRRGTPVSGAGSSQ